MTQIVSTNEFVIKFANVNGSGSASANQMFAKGIFRSGVPVSPKNIFPSNIQGLPTWFEVRISEKGYLGRTEGVDIAVAMNPQSYNEDLKEINSGGYLIYDSSWKRDFERTDINIIEIPLTKLCVEEFSNPKTRLLFKNIVYVGALSYLLGMDKEIYETLIAEQFKGKEKLIAPNIKALNIGYDYASENLKGSCEIKVNKSEKTKTRRPRPQIHARATIHLPAERVSWCSLFMLLTTLLFWFCSWLSLISQARQCHTLENVDDCTKNQT